MKLDSIDPTQVAILLDVDGTLLDIALTPHDVRVPSTLRRTLEKLQERTDGALALVSGRSLSDIDLIFAPLKLSAVGGHGAEIRVSPNSKPNGTKSRFLDKKTRSRLIEVAEFDEGIIMEDKGFSVALHYRLAPGKKRAIEDAVAAICGELPQGAVEILPGKAVIEIKKSGFNKGTALRDLMAHPPFAGRKPIFVGDDVTDEAAFAVVPEFDGIAISVGRMVPGVAQRFEAPSDVRRWLEHIAKDGSGRPGERQPGG
ncbi:MAG TPA: trehalose-phosphatase [Xanthobacteraceae bacterium]|nr:trehalose-phosphatase [Xanthobacteraceae bacterium]